MSRLPMSVVVRRHLSAPLRRALTTVVLAVCASTAAAAGQRLTLPGVTGEDNRVISDSRAHPWRAIGRLNSTLGGFCTATVIRPRQVLTAAHCLWNVRTERWLPPCALHFLADYRRGEYGVHALVAEVHVAEGFDMRKRDPANDWAIVTLDRDVSASTGVVDLAAVDAAPGSALIQAGYSRDRRHVLTVDRTCRVNTVHRRQGLFTHSCDATFGDSGSPILVRTEQGYRLTGVHTALFGRGEETQGVAVSAQAFRGWVEANPVTRPPGGVKACSLERIDGVHAASCRSAKLGTSQAVGRVGLIRPREAMNAAGISVAGLDTAALAGRCLCRGGAVEAAGD